MKLVEGFKYRVSSVLSGITKNVIKQARLKEIKQEILNSEKLKVALRKGLAQSNAQIGSFQ